MQHISLHPQYGGLKVVHHQHVSIPASTFTVLTFSLPELMGTKMVTFVTFTHRDEGGCKCGVYFKKFEYKGKTRELQY